MLSFPSCYTSACSKASYTRSLIPHKQHNTCGPSINEPSLSENIRFFWAALWIFIIVPGSGPRSLQSDCVIRGPLLHWQLWASGFTSGGSTQVHYSTGLVWPSALCAVVLCDCRAAQAVYCENRKLWMWDKLKVRILYNTWRLGLVQNADSKTKKKQMSLIKSFIWN